MSRRSKNATLIYDGDCGFCSTAVRWLERTLPAMPAAVPSQWADLAAFGLTAEEASERAWLVTTDSAGRPRHQYGGHRAFSALLRRQPRASWRFAGWLLVTPGFSAIAAVGYKLITRYRHRLPGGTPACRVPQ